MVYERDLTIGQENEREEGDEDRFDYFYHEPGTMPGTIKVDRHATPSEVDLIDYNRDRFARLTNIAIEHCADYLDADSISWVDVSGMGSSQTLRKLQSVFRLHPLTVEEIANVPQRPKTIEFGDQLTIVTQMAILKEGGEGFWLEQVSFVLGQNYLLSIQEEPDRDSFDRVRDRLSSNSGLIRNRGADYLAYALWDAIIDGFFPILEAYGEQIEELEDAVVLDATEKTLAKIYQLRRELLALRRAVWPQRDAIAILLREDFDLVSEGVKPYLQDCYNHTVQIIDTIEIYRELVSGLMDVYLSVVSNRMNEIMKFLTVISSIFIPLTFVAGIYGMNFNTEVSPWNMPELAWYWGYPACWLLMIAIAASLSFSFWRRGWFQNFSKLDPRTSATDARVSVPTSRDRF